LTTGNARFTKAVTMRQEGGISMRIERIHTRSVVGAARSDTLEQAAETMRRFHVGALLVVDSGDRRTEVVGILTDRDLVMHALAEGLDAHKVKVEKVMSPVVASVPESADVFEALDRMRAAGVRRLLVTDDAGQPAGIVSIDDIVDGLAAELAAAAALMKRGIGRERVELDGVEA
jgi:predicted transcriptional regulator